MTTEAHATEENRAAIPTSLTSAQIDGECVRLRDQVNTATDPTEAEQVEARLLALAAARPLAVARERAAQRREQVEQHRAAHQAFDGLAADLAVEFRARAVAIDAVIGEFAQVMTAYRATVQRLGEFAPSLRQGPSPAPGHEMDLLTRVDKLSVSVLIARQLAVAGVLDPRTVPSGQRDPGFTFESYVMRQLEAFLTVARSWLPPVPDTTTNESPLTEQEGAHHGEQQIRG